jgi:HAD superfamily hydrolase (TIGR01509 family)
LSATMAPAAILFDMDGTLLDTQPIWDRAISAGAARLGIHVTHDGLKSLVGVSTQDTARYLLGLAGLTASDSLVAETCTHIRTLVAYEFAGPIPWRPGAQATLHAVRMAKIRTALVTSTCRDLTELALGTLGRNFDAVVCGDDVKEGKPGPAPYIQAAQLLGVDPADCVAIEDSRPGFLSARAAGCAVILVPHDTPVTISAGLDVYPSLQQLGVPALAYLHVRHRHTYTPVF